MTQASPLGGSTIAEDALATDATSGEPTTQPVLDVRHVTQQFSLRARGGVRAGVVHAVSDVSFDVARGETLGLLGETGCGKSTLARAILQRPRPRSGQVLLLGEDLTRLKGKQLREARRHVQMVFQDPASSLDPMWSVADLVTEALVAHHVGTSAERAARAMELVDLVGLPHRSLRWRARQLSGGQGQRAAIARALALSPELVVCDEAVSSLDVSIQAQILNLLESLKAQLGLSYLFIGHDISVVKHISDRIAVMYLGKLCEVGPAETLCSEPRHPYTAALISAALDDVQAGFAPARMLDDALGEAPSALSPPSGCRYRTRCPYAKERCAEEVPEMLPLGPGHAVACHFPLPAVARNEHIEDPA
jgi:oligopeptide/dipeptide ABC transporter ATP-binding protein